MKNIQTVKVVLWGTTVGYLQENENGASTFNYDKAFLRSGIELSPLKMPLSEMPYSFPSLNENTFHGLPGLLADSLPDRFGNLVIRRYLEAIGRGADELTVSERLCYTGKRGMGALEFEPSAEITASTEKPDIDALAALAEEILSKKENIKINASDGLIAMLAEASSSAGGARAKTLIAWNEKTNEVRSGQINAGSGFDYWLLKFGGVGSNRDKDTAFDAPEYTKTEYAYYLMARAAGINMSECRLYTENGVSHFMTKRFDRPGGKKLHMQSLGAIAHMDFNSPRTDSYEAAFEVMRKLKLGYAEQLEFYRRMLFNHYAYNFDDHVKNISFLMDRSGKWSLAPAYDLTFSYNPASRWVSAHQMLINGKADGITHKDLTAVADASGIKPADAEKAIDRVQCAVSEWNKFAEAAELSPERTEKIGKIINM